MTQNPFNTCPEAEAPTSPLDRELYSSDGPEWLHGVEGVPRPVSPAAGSGIIAMLLGVVILLGLSMPHMRHVFKTLPQDLWSVRRRTNIFDEHTANETRVIVLLILGLFVSEGLLFFMWMGRITPAATTMTVFLTVAALTGLAAAYYLFQMCACLVVGYVFTDKVSAGLWRKGLNASQSILGMTLMLPAMVSLFYPSLTSSMLILSGCLYVLSRISYILKGFRIFYNNSASLLYFILYLCTLEIIPFLFVCLLAAEICVKLQ